MAMLREIWEAWLRLTRYQQGIVIVASLLALFDLYVKHLTAVSIGMIVAVAVTLLPRRDLLSVLKSLELPGLLRLKLRKDLQNAEGGLERAGWVSEPVTEQRDQPIYEQIYDDDPTLSLAALRINIFKRLRDLAKLAQIDILPGRRLRWRWLVKELQSRKILTAEQAETLSDVIPLLDKASRSEEYSSEAADWAIKNGPKLIAGLDELVRAAGGARELLSANRPG